MAHGNGEVKMAMAGGDLSAILVDLTGLEFGNALLSALGMPKKTPRAMFRQRSGIAARRTRLQGMTLDTGEAIIDVGGDVNLGERGDRSVVEDGLQALQHRVAADTDQHHRHIQGPQDPARRPRLPLGPAPPRGWPSCSCRWRSCQRCSSARRQPKTLVAANCCGRREHPPAGRLCPRQNAALPQSAECR